jgi:SAM-dependent methyltransferase
MRAENGTACDQSNQETGVTMQELQQAPLAKPPQRFRRVLNAGAGSQRARPIHELFAKAKWHEIRLDIDPANKPDVVGSIADMRAAFPAQCFDAIWSSHILEHLYAHEVPLALLEFRRVLKPDGFAVISCPDLEIAVSLIIDRGIDEVAYPSPAGPITALDLLYGHSASIARGKVHMAHKTGFTCASLGQRLVDAGFATVLGKQKHFDLWMLALMEQADKTSILKELTVAGLDMFEE